MGTLERVCLMTVVRSLVLLGAICFTLFAAYQWINIAARNWQTFTWSAVMALILWLVWLFATATYA
jgi:hypothetical protein